MAYTTVFVALAPDAGEPCSTTVLRTGTYHLHSMLVRDPQRAIAACRALAATAPLDSIILCPGFSHAQTAELFTAFAGRVAVAVARADSASSALALAGLKREGVIP